MRVACILFCEPVDLKRFAESCLGISPQVAIGPDCIFIEIGACQKIYGELTVHGRLQILLGKFSMRAKIAFANDLPTALAFCIYSVNAKNLLPIEALKFYVDPFLVQEAFLTNIAILKKLGIIRLIDIQKLSPKALGIRFGQKMIDAVRHLSDAQNIPWSIFNPIEKIIEYEKIDETYDIREIEPLLFLLKRLLERAMFRMRGHGKLPSSIGLTFQLEKYSHVENMIRTCKIDLLFPQRAILPLISMSRDRLQHVFMHDPLKAPIRCVQIEILESVPQQSKQMNFFSKKEEELEEFRSIVNRLTEKLGFDKAFLAEPVESYVPEKSWKKTLSEPSSIQSNLPERPLRILSKPHPIKKLAHYFLCAGKKWKALSIIGPERISGEWWFHEKERNYFRIKTSEGEELWIFQALSGEYFLHGIFD